MCIRDRQAAESRGEAFLARYGGKVSSEWLMPKLWQILDEAPEVYAAADRFIEAGDWIVYKLTGVERRSAAIAGYKAFWHKEDGYPSEEFFAALDPRLARVVDEKLSRALYPAGTRAGGLDAFGAKLTGLPVGTPVAVANIDAHVSLPPAGVVEPGRLLMILGTSTCHIVLGAEAVSYTHLDVYKRQPDDDAGRVGLRHRFRADPRLSGKVWAGGDDAPAGGGVRAKAAAVRSGNALPLQPLPRRDGGGDRGCVGAAVWRIPPKERHRAARHALHGFFAQRGTAFALSLIHI